MNPAPAPSFAPTSASVHICHTDTGNQKLFFLFSFSPRKCFWKLLAFWRREPWATCLSFPTSQTPVPDILSTNQFSEKQKHYAMLNIDNVFFTKYLNSDFDAFWENDDFKFLVLLYFDLIWSVNIQLAQNIDYVINYLPYSLTSLWGQWQDQEEVRRQIERMGCSDPSFPQNLLDFVWAEQVAGEQFLTGNESNYLESTSRARSMSRVGRLYNVSSLEKEGINPILIE